METTVKDFLDCFREQSYPNLFSSECIKRISNIETAFGAMTSTVAGYETVVSSADRTTDFAFCRKDVEPHPYGKWYELDYERYTAADIPACFFLDNADLSSNKDNSSFYQRVLPEFAGKERTERVLPLLQRCVQLLGKDGHCIRYIGIMEARAENDSLRVTSDGLPRRTLVSLLHDLHWNGNLEKLDSVLASFEIPSGHRLFPVDFDIFPDHISDKIGFCAAPLNNSVKHLQEYIGFLEQSGLCLPEKGQDIIRWVQAAPSHTTFISNEVAHFKFPFVGDRITKAKVYLRQTINYSEKCFSRFSTPEILNLCLSSGGAFPDKKRSLYWITEAAAAGVRSINLYGTEVLRCPYLKEIVSACRLHGLQVTVPVSAGEPAIQKLVGELAGCGLTGMRIVMEGTLGDAADSFNRTLSAVSAVPRVHTAVSWVVRQENAGDLRLVLDAVEQSGISLLTVCACHPEKAPCPVSLTEPQLMSLSDCIDTYAGPVQIEIDPCFSQLKAIAGRRAFINVNTGIRKGCRAGRDSVTVNSAGRLAPCRYLDYPENFLSIKEYWNNSAVIARLLDAVKAPLSPCSGCPYDRNCIPCFALHTRSADCISMADDTCPLKKNTPPEDRLILTDSNDNQIGTETKLAVHRNGLLHRAFSVFIYSGDSLLIQKRAAGKYHSAGLWANTCCSHPRDGEATADAARRRLQEEAGISCDLHEVQSFVYRAPFANGLTEYEVDHIFAGEYGGAFTCNNEEAEEMKFVDMAELSQDMTRHPEKYAVWFITAYPLFLRSLGR